MNLLIYGIDAQTLTFRLTRDATVDELRQAISSRTSISPSEVKLAYCGKPLRDGDRLADYNVQTDSMVHASLDMVGGDAASAPGVGFSAAQGVGFPFVNITTHKGLKVHQWSKSGGSGCGWRKAIYGLNLEGTCTNSKCKAYNNRVIIPWGQRDFDFAKHDTKENCHCPMCNEYVEPATCAFSKTYWSYSGTMRSVKGKEPVKVKGNWKQAGDAYYTFDEVDVGSAWWLELKILIKQKL